MWCWKFDKFSGNETIYDFNDKKHSNTIVYDKLWEEISKEINVDSNFNINILNNVTITVNNYML